MERSYEYTLCKKTSESYGDITTRILKTFTKQKAIDRMITDAGWLMENEGYQKIKESEPEDQFTIVTVGSRVHYYIEQVEVDYENALWNRIDDVVLATPKLSVSSYTIDDIPPKVFTGELSDGEVVSANQQGE